MRILIPVLFLVSFGSVSMAGVSDVNSYDMKQYIVIENHELKHYELKKFKFIWESKKNIKFGSEDGYFKNDSINLEEGFRPHGNVLESRIRYSY